MQLRGGFCLFCSPHGNDKVVAVVVLLVRLRLKYRPPKTASKARSTMALMVCLAGCPEGERRRLEVGQDEVLGDESDDDARPAAGRLVGLGAVEDASVEQEALAGLEDHLRHAVRGADGRLGQAGAGLQFLDVVGRLEGLQVDGVDWWVRLTSQ